MPRILIAGCGYIGQAGADLFHSAGWAVEGWTGSAESAAALSAKPYPVRQVNISKRAEVAERAGIFDAVIHCASSSGGDAGMYRHVYLDGARNLLEMFPGSKLLFTSSTSVYAQRDGSCVTEESETAPVRETSRILLETESVVLGSGGIVARLAGIYGPGRSALLNKFLAGSAVIDPENDRFVNQVHRDDIAAALFLLLSREAEAAQTYNSVVLQPILPSQCYRWLAERHDLPPAPIGRPELQRKHGSISKPAS